MQKPVFTLKLTESKMISPKVKHFVFSVIDNPEFKFIPGQFISLHFNCKNGQPVKRSYSIATIHGTTDKIEFAATRVENGEGTNFLYNLEPGDTVLASGPFGRLILQNELPKRYIFIGTGTGITPYRSMLSQITDNLKKQDHSVIVLQGIQNPDDALYVEDFLKPAEKFNNYEFRSYYSRHSKDEISQKYEYTGYVQDSFSEIKLSNATDIIYLCGNPYMIEDVVSILKEKQFNSKQILREKYYSKKTTS